MNLFSPIKIGNYNLKNRIFMAPMTRCRSIKDNVPNDLMVEYYAQRATAGLIITEGTQISPQGIGYPYTPGIHTDAQVQGWRKVTKAVHEKEGKIFLQLWHVGRVSHSSFLGGELPVAPSAIKLLGKKYTYEGMKDYEKPRALKAEEIKDIVQDYANAAKNAMDAGFDGVEIHSANGYLLDQFLRDGTNQRKDEYGGSIENRSRFLLEVIKAVTDAVGADKTGVRLSPSGTMNDMSDSNPQKHFAYVCQRLNDCDLAYLHIVDALEGDIRHGANVVELSVLRDAYKGTLIVCGEYDKVKGNLVIENHLANAVAYARLFLANPDLPERFKKNGKLNEPDSTTFYTQDAKGYTDYPTL
ncbi:alkene reductase [Sulfurimonas sp. HSL3-2]|uniref:alkene reductase n=1 Tax=Hydrocurvibacter mobilis TaxID=3131936 RepID=UPI0031F9240C